MISKFNGWCSYCGEKTLAGKDEYDIVGKISYHIACKEADEAEPSPEQFDIADRLSYIQYRQEMGVDGFLRSVSASGGGLAAWGLGTEACRRQEYTLRSGDTVQNISENRGFQSY